MDGRQILASLAGGVARRPMQTSSRLRASHTEADGWFPMHPG
uniref:Uncharacterized protein n=1 Tax=Rhizobium meliloti TaxID=382 RepID=I2E1U7_RHIML|nr:short hypothetical protein [Sinorhizobium meliloti]